MRLDKLIASLKAEAAIFDESSLVERLEALNRESGGGRKPSKMRILSKYNLETMLEIKRAVPAGETPVSEIDDKKAGELRAAVDAYMDRYAPGEETRKIYVGVISVWLSFIAKKPLHPPGFFDPAGKAGYRNGLAVCPRRAEETGTEDSLCRFCSSVVQ